MATPTTPRPAKPFVTRRGIDTGEIAKVGRRRLKTWIPQWSWLVALWRLVKATVGACFRYRVTGLAAEAGFFALLSLPPLVLGLVASVGFLGDELGADNQQAILDEIEDLAGTFLTADSVSSVITPTFEEVLLQGRVDILSIGFLLSLWSGSRALNVYVDTISIMYGLGGKRGIIRTRALSFSLYVVGLVVGAVTVPLVLIGPQLLGEILREDLQVLLRLYWPVVTLMTVASLATLYHVSTPIRTRWYRDVPGALLALGLWVGASFVLRAVISASVGSPSIYGPLAAPIVVLIWLYALALAVLIGAALNASIAKLWPLQRAGDSRTTDPEPPDPPAPEPAKDAAS